jgi:O-antigen/teichoic acid export membrane protein
MSSSVSAVSVFLNKQHRLIYWLRLFAGYSFVQAMAQGLGFLAGILVVRSLSKEAYACFIIVNTIGPLMNMLADNGITSSLSAIGGKFYQDDAKMGSLLRTAMLLRKQLLLLSGLIITPVLIWLLWRNHASTGAIAWLVPITLIGVFFQMNVGVLSTVVNLRQQMKRMQAIVFCGVLPRLALIALLAAIGWLNAPLAIAAGVVALGCQSLLLDYWAKPQIAWGAPPSEEFRRDILVIVKKQAPLTIYFCLQSQITIWLISLFGNVHRVADLGALGRIGMMFTILVSTTSAVVVPRFARCTDPALLATHYARIVVGFFGIVVFGTVLVWLLPGPFLWLLGSQYAHLGSLLWLAVLASGASALLGVLYALNVIKAGFLLPR